MALAVVAMFAFVILPYVDRPAALSGQKLAFDLPVLAGDPGARLNFEDLRGKPVVVDFWASWCQPCRAQMAQVSELQSRMGDRAHIVGVATSDSLAPAEAFVSEHTPPYLNVFDEGSAIARSLQVTALPTLVIVDAEGTVRDISGRPQTAAELEEKLAELLP
jgi:thiol-disulfide isomerase/thioredoxin